MTLQLDQIEVMCAILFEIDRQGKARGIKGIPAQTGQLQQIVAAANLIVTAMATEDPTPPPAQS